MIGWQHPAGYTLGAKLGADRGDQERLRRMKRTTGTGQASWFLDGAGCRRIAEDKDGKGRRPLANRCLQPLGHHSSTFRETNLTPLTSSREPGGGDICSDQAAVGKPHELSHSRDPV
jgi:hypothetical protein